MSYTAPDALAVGHVHLKVAELERAISFYGNVLGLKVMQRMGSRAAFLSAGGYHHHIGLNTWDSAGGTPAPQGHTGLYHVAFLYPDRASLGRAVDHVLNAGIALDGAADHGVSEAVYLRDPDGNGIELYRDRAPSDWPLTTDGNLDMVNKRLDIDALIREGRETA